MNSKGLLKWLSLLKGAIEVQKYSSLLLITFLVTILVKQFAVRLALIRKLPKIDAKVLELVLKCTKSELNHAIQAN